MEGGFIERRRSPRMPMGSGARVVRPVSMAARLLDLSSDGILLSCPDPIAPGASPRIVARLGSRSLDAELDVRHVSSQWDPRVGGYRVGGRFVALGPQARLAVEGLLSGGEHSD
jgi:hypothetical protein